MRQNIINFLKAKKFSSFKISDELPFNNSGTSMYLKNAKIIYVDNEQYSTEVLIPVFNAVNVDSQITTVRVFFTSDSKKQPQDYGSTVQAIQSARALGIQNGYFKSEVDVSTEMDQDLVITTVEFRFTKLI